MITPKRILVVDDDLAMSTLLRDFLSRNGFRVTTSSSVFSALDRIRSAGKEPPDLVISDVKLGASSGTDLAKQIATEYPRIPVILFSVLQDIEKEALEAGAKRFLKKPFSLEKLVEIVRKELESIN